MAHRYAAFVDDGGDTDTDVDLIYFTEASTDAGGDTDSEYARMTARPPPRSLPLGVNFVAQCMPHAKNAKIYVMFMQARRAGLRGALSCRDYLVNDVMPHVTRCEFVHAELVFGQHRTTVVSAMNTNGVTFVENKRYTPEDYPVVFEIEVSERKYAQTFEFVEKYMAGRGYDTTYFYLFCCIGMLGMTCNLERRADRFTCAAAVAAILSMVGIGDSAQRTELRTNKNITAEGLYNVMDAAYAGKLLISKTITCIRKLDGPPQEMQLPPRSGGEK